MLLVLLLLLKELLVSGAHLAADFCRSVGGNF